MAKGKDEGSIASSSVGKRKKRDPNASQTENVILQLPISSNRINEILKGEQQCMEPVPYFDTNSSFQELTERVVDQGKRKTTNANTVTGSANGTVKRQYCFWCVHEIPTIPLGMPIRHNAIYDTYTVYGAFCSYECASAFNFDMNKGTDRCWEVDSYIQILSRMAGYVNPVRAAPSRYTLEMFGGTLGIDEFRSCHKDVKRTYVVNMPPFISITPQVESVNTSFLTAFTGNATSIYTTTDRSANKDKSKLTRAKSIVDYSKTLDSKMNLSVKETI